MTSVVPVLRSSVEFMTACLWSRDLIHLRKMAISKSTNTYNRQNWEDSVSYRPPSAVDRFITMQCVVEPTEVPRAAWSVYYNDVCTVVGVARSVCHI